jgi:hypothetical protein
MYRKLLIGAAALLLMAGSSANEPLEHVKRENAAIDGVMGAVHNAQQRLDSTARQMKLVGSRPGAAVVTNLITAIDGQIDNLAGTINTMLIPLTGGLSSFIIGPLLGPTFQSMTDGIEVLLGNTIGGVADLALVPAMHMLAGSMSNAANLAGNLQMKNYQMKFVNLQKQAQTIATQKKPKKHLVQRYADLATASAGAIATIAQSIDNVISTLKDAGADPSSEDITSFMSSFQEQVGTGVGMAQGAMAAVGSPNSLVTSAILSPVMSSTVNGVEVLISSISSGKVDAAFEPGLQSLSSQVMRLSSVAQQYNMDGYASSLQAMSQKLIGIAAGVVQSGQSEIIKRAVGAVDKANAGFRDVQQKIDGMSQELRAAGARPSAEAVNEFLSGMDSQINYMVGMVGSNLKSGGLSDRTSQTILSPVFQSITDGVDVLIDNSSGVLLDVSTAAPMHILVGSLANVANVAAQYNMNNFQAKFVDQGNKLAHIATITTAHQNIQGGNLHHVHPQK